MGISESEAGEKRYSKPTNLIRSPRLTWNDTSSKSARPAKDFESCETVSITESAQCPLVRCAAARLVNHELTLLRKATARQARMNTKVVAAGADRGLDNWALDYLLANAFGVGRLLAIYRS